MKVKRAKIKVEVLFLMPVIDAKLDSPELGKFQTQIMDAITYSVKDYDGVTVYSIMPDIETASPFNLIEDGLAYTKKNAVFDIELRILYDFDFFMYHDMLKCVINKVKNDKCSISKVYVQLM